MAARLNDNGVLVLSTGTEIHTSIMGVETLSLLSGQDGRPSDLVYGYDAYAEFRRDGRHEFGVHPRPTPAERREIADFMIAIWNRWADEKDPIADE